MTSPGPILFRQTRLGRAGQPFTCYKFRSMTVSAESEKADLLHLNEANGPVFKVRNDPRMTRAGKWLRRLSIDELPQLINVLVGEMSLVGPRPPLPDEVAKYEPRQRGRLAVKPELTCIWQVSGRSNIGFEEWIELDLEYIRKRGIWLDVTLIVLTIPAVLRARGAC
jgi:lipopolysaccharide/colanic/teichoic acid biosynthesis glycosyltransferase